MKKIIILLLVLSAAAGFGYGQVKPGENSSVEVYYFHGKRRCATCVSIEENTKKTVETYFKDQKAKGTVKMIVVDIDDKKNEALVEKYEVTSSSLFVTINPAFATEAFPLAGFIENTVISAFIFPTSSSLYMAPKVFDASSMINILYFFFIEYNLSKSGISPPTNVTIIALSFLELFLLI